MGNFNTAVTRRDFSIGFAAGLTSLPFLTAGARSAIPCQAPAETRIRVIDAAHDISSDAGALKAHGVSTVIRYYSRENGEFPISRYKGGGNWRGKVPTIQEIAALKKEQLSLAVVFQYNSSSARTFRDGFRGERHREIIDADWALQHAAKLDQPKETAIYFGADFNLNEVYNGADATESNKRAIRRYFTYIRKKLDDNRMKVGVYGCGATCKMLQEEGLADFFWISESMSYLGTDKYYNEDRSRWHLYQNKGNILKPFDTKVGQRIDTNLANDRFEWFGQWGPDGEPSREPQEISRNVLSFRRFIRTRTLCLRGAPRALPERERSLLGDPYARTVRVLCDSGDHVGISLVESDQLLGYCRREDLQDMTTMPTYGNKARAPLSKCT